MTDKQIKVGDVVNRGRNVPPGTLVKTPGGRFIWRRGNEGQIVKAPGFESWGVDAMSWWQWYATTDQVTIIALDVPADATADDLRTIAEVFEVREALMSAPRIVKLMHTSVEDMNTYECPECSPDEPQAWTWAAERLHCVGWRSGMTAEDAARLLAEVHHAD